MGEQEFSLAVTDPGIFDPSWFPWGFPWSVALLKAAKIHFVVFLRNGWWGRVIRLNPFRSLIFSLTPRGWLRVRLSNILSHFDSISYRF